MSELRELEVAHARETWPEAWSRAAATRLERLSLEVVVLGVAGPSGVGKSTLARRLADDLSDMGQPAMTLGMDDFFHGPEVRDQLGGWGPEHVRFDELAQVLSSLRGGARVVNAWRYERSPCRRVTKWRLEAPPGTRVIVFEGLYALSRDPVCGNLGRFVDVGIFVEADLGLVRQWRFQQERAKPSGRSDPAMQRHWERDILPDTHQRVYPCRARADLVVRKGEDHSWRLSACKWDELLERERRAGDSRQPAIDPDV